MQTSLQRNHASADPGLHGIDAWVERRSATVLALRFVVAGALDGIVVPPPATPERTHGLWEGTCLEAFFRSEDGRYFEFNFSPSGQWAAYRFSGYRNGMAEAPMATPPHIRTTKSAERLEVEVELELTSLADTSAMNLAAVILSQSGERSFWATEHAPGEPDFHDPRCFIHQLPAAPAP